MLEKLVSIIRGIQLDSLWIVKSKIKTMKLLLLILYSIIFCKNFSNSENSTIN